MDVKIFLLGVLFLASCIYIVEADFLYNRVLPKTTKEAIAQGFKCIPGRTVLKIGQPPKEAGDDAPATSADEDNDPRRSHMKFHTDSEICQICVCSVEGKDKYCSNRPAMNVNECLLMGKVMKKFSQNLPFDHETSLMVRRGGRDYLWHDDEIPYEAKAKCPRAHSYYSNNIDAENADIDVESDVDSLLDYKDRSVCFYCVCNVDGRHVGCISRAPWYCEYFRNIRDYDEMRKRYQELFQQDRPAYFRQLSYRLRRTMDGGMFDLVETGGDAVCCDHPSGHRMNLHNKVRGMLQSLKRRVNKENVMENYAGGDYVDFVVNND